MVEIENAWSVRFWNPGTRQVITTSWSSWQEAMARCAHYTRKYGQFDGFVKPRLLSTR